MSFLPVSVINFSASNLVSEITNHGTIAGYSASGGYNRKCLLGVNQNDCYFCYIQSGSSGYVYTKILSKSAFRYGLFYERDNSVNVYNADYNQGCYVSGYTLSVDTNSLISGVDVYANIQTAIESFLSTQFTWPINYYRTGCTITGPLDAAPGQDCVITVNSNQGYTFKGSSGVRIVDSSGANIPFIVSGNQVSFTYPQPI